MQNHIPKILFGLLFALSVLSQQAPVCLADGSPGYADIDDYLDSGFDELLNIPLDPNQVNIHEGHIHKKGEWMVGFRYMHMDMQGNLNDDSRIGAQEILSDYRVAPTAMYTEKFMGALMYAPHEDVTLMLMLPYYKKAMSHQTRMGMMFDTHSEGIGDLTFHSHIVLFRSKWNRHLVNLHLGAGFPTGSINRRGNTPAGLNQKLPYPMQLGSGTYDILPGIVYNGIRRDWSWGSYAQAVIRTGKNDNHYRLGNQVDIAGWLTRSWKDWFSSSLRLEGHWWGNITGADPELDITSAPTANPNARAGKRLDLVLSLELYAPEGKLEGQHLGVEIGTPLYQSLDGPQLEMDWRVSAAWQWTF